MLRPGRRLLRYYQEIFQPRQEVFLMQVMRGLKIEKRWEPGMGSGIFAREGLARGELVMFDLPFLTTDFNELPVKIRDAMAEFKADEKIRQVIQHVVHDVAFESKQTPEKVQAWIQNHGLDADIVWMTLIACWAVCWCHNSSPNSAIPFNYFSYTDDPHADQPVNQMIMEIAHQRILDATGLNPQFWSLEDFWVSLFKYKSNVMNGALYPVAPTLINHSCWPNASFAEDGALVALRDIPPNEQVMVALYGRTCAEVEQKGLAGKKFKCFTPGCQWSKRVPLPEPEEEKEEEERLYLTPWHAMTVKMPRPGHDVPYGKEWKTPAGKKYQAMWETEVSRAGRDLGGTPQLPGTSPKRHLISRNGVDADGFYLTPRTAKGRELIPNKYLPGSKSDHL
ncbi:hypothetical protein DIPPA_05950 [Diplonema papillatum]|nr:hypothetical protein DIPPA_05950 [Diplonema papillatum]